MLSSVNDQHLESIHRKMKHFRLYFNVFLTKEMGKMELLCHGFVIIKCVETCNLKLPKYINVRPFKFENQQRVNNFFQTFNSGPTAFHFVPRIQSVRKWVDHTKIVIA